MLVLEYKIKAKPNPKFLKKAEPALKHAQRQIYKKKKESNNRRQARKQYSKKHLTISRQRNEHAKKLARDVCQSNDLIAYVRRSRCRRLDLKIRNMVKCHDRAKSIFKLAAPQLTKILSGVLSI